MTDGRSLKCFFEGDHERLDLLFATYRKLKSDSYARAIETFFIWKAGLLRHIQFEEQLVFPLFVKKTGNEGTIRLMRLEHRRISDLLEQLSNKIDNEDQSTDVEEYQLLILLGEHALKEEMVLYPCLEAWLTEQETAEVFQLLSAFAP